MEELEGASSETSLSEMTRKHRELCNNLFGTVYSRKRNVSQFLDSVVKRLGFSTESKDVQKSTQEVYKFLSFVAKKKGDEQLSRDLKSLSECEKSGKAIPASFIKIAVELLAESLKKIGEEDMAVKLSSVVEDFDKFNFFDLYGDETRRIAITRTSSPRLLLSTPFPLNVEFTIFLPNAHKAKERVKKGKDTRLQVSFGGSISVLTLVPEQVAALISELKKPDLVGFPELSEKLTAEVEQIAELEEKIDRERSKIQKIRTIERVSVEAIASEWAKERGFSCEIFDTNDEDTYYSFIQDFPASAYYSFIIRLKLEDRTGTILIPRNLESASLRKSLETLADAMETLKNIPVEVQIS